MKSTFLPAILFLPAWALLPGCQTPAPVRPLVAKPVTDLPVEQLTGKQLKVVGNAAGFEAVVLEPEQRFTATGSKGDATQGEWHRRGDQVLLLAEATGGLRTYSMCRLKELNGQLCLYYESEGQFADRRARQEMTRTAQTYEQAVLQEQAAR